MCPIQMKDELLYRTFHQVGAVVIGPIHNSFEGLVAEWEHHHRFKFFRKLNKTIGKFASFLNANWNGRTRGALNSVLREILPKICIIMCKKQTNSHPRWRRRDSNKQHHRPKHLQGPITKFKLVLGLVYRLLFEHRYELGLRIGVIN